MIRRPVPLARLRSALGRSRVVVLSGPRQCGKTTLARELLPADSPNYFDLEDPASLARLDEPMTALAPLKGLVVIDEVPRRPDLFPILRVLVDRQPKAARFLILGRASGDLLRQTSESLAGRMERVTLSGFSLAEVPGRAEESPSRDPQKCRKPGAPFGEPGSHGGGCPPWLGVSGSVAGLARWCQERAGGVMVQWTILVVRCGQGTRPVIVGQRPGPPCGARTAVRRRWPRRTRGRTGGSCRSQPRARREACSHRVSRGVARRNGRHVGGS
jgi:hypothetical protein